MSPRVLPPRAEDPARPPTLLGRRVATASVVLAAVATAATVLHVEQLWRATRHDAEERVGILARILSREVERGVGAIEVQIDYIGEALRGWATALPVSTANAILSAQVQQNTLLREVALLDGQGRVVASSDPTHVGLDLPSLDFARFPRDGRLHVGVPTEGRSLGAGPRRQGAEWARTGFLTFSRAIDSAPGVERVVAVIGADSLANDLQRLAGEDRYAIAVYRYDGALLATDDSSLRERVDHPIFRTYLPDRERGGFVDRTGDGQAWIAHFDSAEKFPILVEVREPESAVTARWRGELVEPLGLLALILAAIAAYTWVLGRSLRQQAAWMEKVRTQERRLRNILDTAADGIVTIDERGVIREFNRAAEPIFGVTASEAVGRPIAELLPPEFADHQAYLERYLATGEARVIGQGRIIETRRRDGSPLVVNLAVSEVSDQGSRYFTGIVRDVTEVRDAEQRFRLLFQRSGEPHLLFDAGRLVDCNDAALALLGADGPDVIRGRTLDAVVGIAPGPAAEEGATTLDGALARARGDGLVRLECLVHRVDGTSTPAEMTVIPVRVGGHGDVLLVSLHDIADRKRHEAGLRAARDAAESVARAKSSFLAMMSHEIRTPMTGIIGMVELLEDTRLAPDQVRYVTALHASARSLLRVLNDVLDYSKMEAGKLEIEDVPFEPAAVAQEVADVLSSVASSRGNRIEKDWEPGGIPRVRGDPTRLRQVLTNLVGNALKFTERGTVTVSIRTRLGADPDSVRVRFEVRDTGIGIAPEILPTLFAPFQQGDGSTTRRFGGTGLGLAICRKVVGAMGGEIGVESTPGAGSTFWFEVPFPLSGRDRAEVVPPARPSAAVPEDRSRRILVAEDSPVNRLLIGSRLRQAGHVVTLVEDGVAAVEAAREGAFDLVLMDMQMPRLDGVGATREIRKLQGPRGRVPIIALTADALPEFREHYMKAGLDDYLTKPIDWTALEAVIDRHTAPALA